MENECKQGEYFKKLFDRGFGYKHVSLVVNFVIIYFLLDLFIIRKVSGFLILNQGEILSIVAIFGVMSTIINYKKQVGGCSVSYEDFLALKEVLKGWTKVYSFTEKKKVYKRTPPLISVPLGVIVIFFIMVSFCNVVIDPWVGFCEQKESSVYEVFLAIMGPIFVYGLTRVVSSGFMKNEKGRA